jgi:hypothetical protein
MSANIALLCDIYLRKRFFLLQHKVSQSFFTKFYEVLFFITTNKNYKELHKNLKTLITQAKNLFPP